MSHPFQVSGRYRNRIGEYEVVSIEGDMVLARYRGGGTLRAPIADLQRIWENILADESVQPVSPKGLPAPVSSSKRPRLLARKSKFQGLVAPDFKDNVAGTSWRAKDHRVHFSFGERGGIISKALSGRAVSYLNEHESHKGQEEP